MTKCKKKNCPNEVQKGQRYCRFHQAQREDFGKKLLGLAPAVLMGGIGLFKKIKK
ncbi:hypothetical protein [Aerococcus viridans]|uniref:hypothetical protein n=1 Tax=Aerococcus viridans TaxID=1377 RepID=UPI003B21E626